MKLTQKITLLLFISSTLFISCSKDDTTATDNTTIKTFKDVTFSLDQSEGYDAGLYFSTELGKSYKTKQIDAAILPKIDIEFYSSSDKLNYFTSPNDGDYGLKNATLSLFINTQKDLLTIEQFNKIEKGSDFDALKIDTDDDDSFPDSQMPNVVLFKNAAGKKGAIYIKSVHRVGYDPRIVVDIKVQK
ncbi:hypothetical protein [Flavobacterium aestivum]|uniref:hypothetical protein n=1 Tax=Flavobacterium aestivum TaxID=3003257 RepID=UPI002285A9E1|nr:hypothetical protein [Flavobacterium aestivum]